MLKQPTRIESSIDAEPRIVAFVFESPLFAHEAYLAAMRLQEDGLVTIHDAVFVSRRSRCSASVTETTDPTPAAAAVPSSLVGALVGMLVAGPLGFLIGGVLAGASGALAAKLIDLGIPDRLIVQLRKITQPGQSALALQVDLAGGELGGSELLQELRRFQGAQLVYSQLPPAQAALVQQALHASA
ncbi:MAG: hypothetical protein JWO36_589 [Myxococcales bacterium]|nr:hypothetical protein [Myxococcales bacterium]